MYKLPNIPYPFEFPNDDFNTTPEGLLAIGGNLHPLTLLSAYSKGIFPWFNRDDPLLWWHPDPRLVIFPDKVHKSHKMQSLIKQKLYTVTFDQDYQQVMWECAHKRTQKREDTWITPQITAAFLDLHKMGFGHSVEVWNQEKQLVGGMYGLAIGKIFFGESMFSHEPNTSKLALIWLCELLKKNDYLLLDCQVESEHLKTLGAELIARKDFLYFLKQGQTNQKQPGKLKLTINI